jgi:8-oxo-dGTP pyrophosphatase MutT (NUDIX family)
MTNSAKATLPVAIPAATIVLYRENADGPAEHLMIERTVAMAFAAGALVFPGGRVEADDHAIATNPDLALHAPDEAADAAGRVAAIRETIEEVGVAVGVTPAPSPATITSWRAALKAGQPLLPLLQQAGVQLDLACIVPFARWNPRLFAHRLFDTRFYIALCPQDALAVHDTDEAAHHVWLSAAVALEADDAGRYRMIFPTRCNAERLAAHPRFADMLAHLAVTPMQVITPWIAVIDGAERICIPEDAGYPVTSALLEDLKKG